MKKMIVAALALMAINAQAQVGMIAPSLLNTDNYMACASNDAQATANCMQVNRDLNLRRQYHLDEMTPAQKAALQEMAEKILSENK